MEGREGVCGRGYLLIIRGEVSWAVGVDEFFMVLDAAGLPWLTRLCSAVEVRLSAIASTCSQQVLRLPSVTIQFIIFIKL